MSQPQLSIITVNLNNNRGLIQSINSIRAQSFQSYEHIIIDAGSTDESQDTIIQYSKTTSHLTYWISEPDKGIYDGMNKGIEHAKGKYLYFLNSGDCLEPEILQSIPFDETQYIYGNIRIIPLKGKPWTWKYPDIFDTYFLANKEWGWISQQACFIHHSLFINQKYDTNYKIISDWIHAVSNIILKGCSYKHVQLTIAEYMEGGISSDYDKTYRERNKWIQENIPDAYFKAFEELDTFRETGFGSLVTKLNSTTQFKRRAKKIINVLYYIHRIFSFHKHQ